MNTPEVAYWGMTPEITLVVTAFAVLLAGALASREAIRSYLWVVPSAGLGLALVFSVIAWSRIEDKGPELHLSGMLAVDGFATFAKFALAVFGILTVWLGRDYFERMNVDEERSRESRRSTGAVLDPEFYALVLFAVAGMMLMASSADLIMIFLALETFSIALYVLVGFRRRSAQSQESSMKYFLLGAFSSTFFLLGIALTYGATGTTNLYPPEEGGPSIVGFLGSTGFDGIELLILGTGLIVVGLGFKIAAVPFHSWTPDAYQGAPSPVTGFMAAGSKLAGFAALLRVLDVTLYPLRDEWQPLVLGIAALTMVVGSVLAVVQEDLKRVLAYSSIAHAGFVLTGVVAANDDGISGSLFYLATYGVTILGAFAIVSMLADRDEQRVRLVDYRGLFYRQPLVAGALTLFLLSLAGVPLTSGFVGKFLVFGAAIQAGYSWLVVIGVLTSAIAAFFYLRVLVVMYMEEAEEEIPVRRPIFSQAIIGAAAVITIVLGILWGPLIDLAERATIIYP
ncbi:MAG: NADH-quinone oxidoreductase subunit NuoN [Actinomycetota bacterium]|nr:NADH-quinone oxidoreductase subunit NuoN [Actinomycetota bacterium]